MKRKNPGHGYYLLIAVALLIFFMLYNSNFSPRSTILDRPINATVDLSIKLKTINISYGMQDKGLTLAFDENVTIQQLYLGVKTDYYRIWIQNGPYTNYMLTTIPLQNDCVTYDYYNLTRDVQTTLDLGIKPYMSFSFAPYCMSGGKEDKLPYNFTLFCNYTATVVKHYYDACASGELRHCGRFEDWRWEIWNEPMSNDWWNNTERNYPKLFAMCYKAIKEAVPSAVVGSAGSTGKPISYLYSNLTPDTYPDFYSNHLYDNKGTSDPGMGSQYLGLPYNSTNRWIYYDKVNAEVYAVRTYKASTEYFNGEYNMDWRYMPKTNQWIPMQEGASWYASALYWQVLTNMTGENLFTGTGEGWGKTFGIWYINGTVTPTYYMKKEWVTRFKPGTEIFKISVNNKTYTTETDVGVMASDSDIVLFNRIQDSFTVELNITGDYNLLSDSYGNNILKTGDYFYVHLQPFDVRFFNMSRTAVINTSTSNETVSNFTNTTVADNETTNETVITPPNEPVNLTTVVLIIALVIGLVYILMNKRGKGR